jgi:uncharacterized protein YunC (DUF1805 family)
MACHSRLETPEASRAPAIVLSHMAGAGAHEVALALMPLMQAVESGASMPWTLFDRPLLEKVLLDHDLPLSLEEFAGEDARPYLQDALDELVGVIPPSWDLLPEFARTIRRLVGGGHVILVGRAASYLTCGMATTFQVHLVASQATRVNRIQTLNQVTRAQAEALVAEADSAQERYVESHFNSVQEEGLSHHLVLNTDRIPCGEAAALIAGVARIRWARAQEPLQWKETAIPR